MAKRKPPAHTRLPSHNGKALPDEYFSSTPIEFQHLQKIRPGYNMASTGEREKAPVRMRAAKAKQEFSAAHEGPREKVGKPEQKLIYTPLGNVAYEVHAQHEREAMRRNREKDLQMRQWRGVKVGNSRNFNARSMAPTHLRPQDTPELFSQRGRHHNDRDDLGRGH